MAVTTGKETKTTSGGPGGPNGPNSGPSTGGGGQKAASSPSPAKSSTTPASKASSSPSAAGKSSSPSSGASKPSNPSGGSLSAPARTAPSSGITSRTPSQQSANDKLKQSATQYGGAQTSMRNASTASKAPTQSAKVTDPSRGGLSSPMGGQGSSFKSPEAAKKANDKYTDTHGFYNRVTKSLPSAGGDVIDQRGRMGPFKGPGPNGTMYDRTFDMDFNPNKPLTSQDIDRIIRNRRDAEDSYLRGLKGVEMDDDYRTPQEVREAVQRRMDERGRFDAKAERESLLRKEPDNEIDRLKNEINSLKARVDASRLTPDVKVGPSRGLFGNSSTFSGANSILGDASISRSSSISMPGRTDRQTPQTTAPGRDDRQTPQTTAPGRTDRQPSPTVSAPGKTDRALTATRSGTDTAWGGGSLTPQQTAAGRTDRQTPQTVAPGRDDRQTPQTVATNKADRAPAPSVARPSDQSFIDSLVNNGPSPGAYDATGSILGMQPTGPSLGQVIARDPIDYTGPRIGAAPYSAAPPSRNMSTDPVGQAAQSDNIAERVVNAMKQAAARPPKIADRVAPAVAPSMPDPRLAAMQEQFERIKMGRGQLAAVPQSLPNDPATPPPQSIPTPTSMKMVGNPTMSPANPFGTYNPVAAGRLATLQTRIGVDDALSAPVPPAAAPPAAPSVPMRQGDMTNPMYRDPMAQAQAVRAAVAMGLGNLPQQAAPQPQFQNTGQPMEIDIPGYPGAVAPSQQDDYDLGAQGGLGVQAYRGNVASPPLNVPYDSTGDQRDEYYGGGPTPRDVASPMPPASGAEAISPSQEGSYPPNDNFMQDDGQPQSLGELGNRYDYEKARAKEGLTELPSRLWAAITSGDIRGYTPETNDKRVSRPPVTNQGQQPQLTDADAAAVARLLALIKQLEQLGGNQSQADLVNSTFI